MTAITFWSPDGRPMSATQFVEALYGKLQELFRDEDELREERNVYKFTSNYIFTSPSGAAAVVLGRSANGWLEWKYQNGKTLDDVKRQNGK